MRIYAIGDVHGQLGMLEDAHARIEADREATGDSEAQVVHLGDLVDRGPDSRGVLDLLISGIAEGRPWLVIRGNHDAMFREFLSETNNPDDNLHPNLTWLSDRVGGSETLQSYGVRTGFLKPRSLLWQEAWEKVPTSHERFLSTLPLMHATPDILFVHAGIRPGVPIAEQVENDMLWIRDPFLSDTRDHGLLIVHGHTPVDRAQHCGNRVALDTGAGFGRELTAAVFEGRDCWILTEDGRVPLRPPY